MRKLRAADITRLVEWGENKHALDRAYMLLRISHPQASREDLLQMPIGVRDRLLLEVRRSLFGSKLELVARCASCRLSLEFRMTVEDLLSSATPSGVLHVLTQADFELAFR